jgi:hypothetical protein
MIAKELNITGPGANALTITNPSGSFTKSLSGKPLAP